MSEGRKRDNVAHLPRTSFRALERKAAMALVENLLVRRHDRADILKGLRLKFGEGVTEFQMNGLMREVTARWREETEEDRPLRSEAQRRALMRLYREAEKDKDWRVCVEVERILSKLDGTAAPLKVAVGTASEWSELEGRSIEEMTFYAKEGFWPEQAPTPPTPKTNGANGKTNGHGANGHGANGHG